MTVDCDVVKALHAKSADAGAPGQSTPGPRLALASGDVNGPQPSPYPRE